MKSNKHIAISIILTVIILISCYPVNLVAQVTMINGRNFEKQNDKWFQIENGKSYEVDKKFITVKYKTGISASSINQYQTQKNIKVIRSNTLGFIDLEIPNGSDPIAVVQDFINSGLIEIAEPNTIGEYVGTPNDPYFSNQWSLNNTGQSGGTTDADIDAVEAWNVETGKSSVIIGVLDSGTDWLHDDLGLGLQSYQNIWLNPGEDAWTFVPSNPNDPCIGNGVDNDGNGYLDDWKGWDFDPYQNNNNSRGTYFHGTHVAGIAAAKTNNGVGIAGVAGGWGASGTKLMVLGVGNSSPNSSVLDDAILYAASKGAKVITMSLEVGQTSAIDAALQTAYQTYGCFIDCSSGNEGGSVGYPASNQYVVAVGATDRNDVRPWWSNYGSNLDVTAPGVDIYSTTLNNSYINASGTSMASPHVAGIAALIWSANPSLTRAQVTDIIQQTAEDKGTTGRDDYYGWGRVNANQAVLLAMAYANKSTTYYASGYNNNHTIERGYNGKLYEVFHSGGEIFYRRSSNNGTNWEMTTRLSSGNGSNDAPSIVAGYSDVLCAVWQNKIDSRHYNIMYSFSSNSGTNWTTPAIVAGCSNVWISYYQSGDYYGPGPTPVIASFFQGGSEGSSSFLLVFAAENGLHYRYANSYNSGWSIPSNDIVPGSYGSSSQIWYPSLASYNSQDYHVNLIYGVRFGSPNQIYSQIFNDDYPDGSWLSRVAVDWVGTYNRCPSLALDYANNTLSVWSGWNGSNYTTRFRQGFSDGTWSSWMKEWSVSGYNSFNPVITYYNKGGSYPYGIDILWNTSNNQIRQKKYYGLGDNWLPADPNTQLLASNGMFANITHERQNTVVPMQTWTDQSTSPLYSILYNSSYLPKENLLASGEIRRAALIGDASSNSGLSVALSQPVLRTLNGNEIVVPFKGYDYSAKIDLTTANIFDYLQTEPFNITDDIETISFKVTVTASQPDTLSDRTLNTNHQTPFRGINFELLAKENSSQLQLASVGSQTLNNALGLHNVTKTFTFNAQVLKGKEIYLLPKANLNGSFKPDNLHFGLANISIEGSPVFPKDLPAEAITPKEYLLEQNYPNPFNPVTTINYQLPKSGSVTLKIFDILGNEVKTLVNEQQEMGKYTAQFDASSLASGMYVYRLRVNDYISTKKMLLLK